MSLIFKCDLNVELAQKQYGFCTMLCGGEHLSKFEKNSVFFCDLISSITDM